MNRMKVIQACLDRTAGRQYVEIGEAILNLKRPGDLSLYLNPPA